jgi:hypothetical protein
MPHVSGGGVGTLTAELVLSYLIRAFQQFIAAICNLPNSAKNNGI